MSDPDMPTDDKYTVFHTEALYQLLGELGLPPWSNNGEVVGIDWDCAPIAEQINARVQNTKLNDAVVIRRQDLFASPCLATYANMIGLVASREADPKTKAGLLDIADYFERQAQLAAEEGFKLPTL